MNMKMEEAPALADLRVHLAQVAEMLGRLMHVSTTTTEWRQTLKGYSAQMPNLAALEKAESDAMAAAALGEADSAIAQKASEALAAARTVATDLGPKIKAAESTIAGLERQEAEAHAALAELEAAGPAALLAYLKEEMEAEAVRYVKAASALTRHHSRLRALGALAAKVGLSWSLSGLDLKLVIGRMDWPRAFVGQQVANNPKLLCEAGTGLHSQAVVQAAQKEEIDRLKDELGVSFRAVAEKLKAGA